MIQLFTLVFNLFLVCSNFFTAFISQLLKVPIVQSSTWDDVAHTCQTWLGPNLLSILGQPSDSSHHISFNLYNQVPSPQPTTQQLLLTCQPPWLIPIDLKVCHLFFP